MLHQCYILSSHPHDKQDFLSTTTSAQLSDPLPPDALEGVALIMSQANQDCDQACGKSGKRCSAQHMHLINSCDRLREKVRWID